mgnify:CR=1 FL=1
MKYHAGQEKQRGASLLVALLVITSLAGMAMLLVQKLSFESLNSGNYKISKQGYYLTEAGLMSPLVQAATNQNTFLSFLQSNQYIVRTNDISNNFYEFNSLGSFGPEFASDDSALFVSYFSDPVDTKRIPGFSTEGFCYRKYTMTADGFLGTSNFDAEDPRTISRTSRRRFISHVYLGPFQCGQ